MENKQEPKRTAGVGQIPSEMMPHPDQQKMLDGILVNAVALFLDFADATYLTLRKETKGAIGKEATAMIVGKAAITVGTKWMGNGVAMPNDELLDVFNDYMDKFTQHLLRKHHGQVPGRAGGQEVSDPAAEPAAPPSNKGPADGGSGCAGPDNRPAQGE